MSEINSTTHNHDLIGGRNNNLLFGMGGNDRLCGNVGDDQLEDCDESDLLIGGAGNDSLGGCGVGELPALRHQQDDDDVVKAGDNCRDKIVSTTPISSISTSSARATT